MPEERFRRFHILHTNDIHSQFEQMPKIKTYVDEVRKRVSSDEMLLVDIGDHMDRMRMETEGSIGLVNLEIMQTTGYEAMVLGNNEGITFTKAELHRVFASQSHLQVVTSNLMDHSQENQLSWIKPYRFIQKGQLTIGLIGVTAPYQVYYNLMGWEVLDPFEVTRDLVSQLRQQVDLLIVMSHLGLTWDQRLAQEIPGIDLILGGHTHHLLEQPLVIGSTVICAAGKLGLHIGHIVIKYDPLVKSIDEISARVVDMTKIQDDEEVNEILDRHRHHSMQLLNEVIVTLPESLPLDWYQESPLGNLLADGLRRWTQAEIGLVNSGQLLFGLHQGPLTKWNMLQVCPGPINPVKMVITGECIWQALEESLQEDFTRLPIRGFGFRGEVLGCLAVSGMQIMYNLNRPPYQRITAIDIDDKPMDRNREYTVGTIDMFTFKVGYPTLSLAKQVEYYLPEFLRDVLTKQVCDLDQIQSSHRRKRWVDETNDERRS